MKADIIGKSAPRRGLSSVLSINHRLVNYIHEPPRDKTNKMTVRPAKTQISLGIRPVWSESSLSGWRKLGPLATQWAHSEDSGQTGRMPRLIWVFAGRTVTLLVLSWGRSHTVSTSHHKKVLLNMQDHKNYHFSECSTWTIVGLLYKIVDKVFFPAKALWNFACRNSDCKLPGFILCWDLCIFVQYPLNGFL